MTQGTCNEKFGSHRCGAPAALWVEVELPITRRDTFLTRYRTSMCREHIAALQSRGAEVTVLDAVAVPAA